MYPVYAKSDGSQVIAPAPPSSSQVFTQTLLENLERELKTNPPMQSELSEIAKASVESVANSLRIASKEEKQ
jgi:hypothetical protein